MVEMAITQYRISVAITQYRISVINIAINARRLLILLVGQQPDEAWALFVEFILEPGIWIGMHRPCAREVFVQWTGGLRLRKENGFASFTVYV
jgi:hypothetical protein